MASWEARSMTTAMITLNADKVTRYRIAARANFLAQDKMDIVFSTKEATRRMTRIGRYLVRYPTVVNWYKH